MIFSCDLCLFSTFLKNGASGPSVWCCMLLISGPRRQRQVDLCVQGQPCLYIEFSGQLKLHSETPSRKRGEGQETSLSRRLINGWFNLLPFHPKYSIVQCPSFFHFFVLFGDKVSLCGPSGPGTQYVT